MNQFDAVLMDMCVFFLVHGFASQKKRRDRKERERERLFSLTKRIKKKPKIFKNIFRRMPGIGGVEATRQLRALGHAVPIVALTANASERDRDECMEANFDGFLSKPVTRDRLAEALVLAISGRARFQDEVVVYGSGAIGMGLGF
jgi:DNA-binding NarL/FixJ family response regulator